MNFYHQRFCLHSKRISNDNSLIGQKDYILLHLIGKPPVKLRPPEKIPAIIVKTLDTILPPREFEVNYPNDNKLY